MRLVTSAAPCQTSWPLNVEIINTGTELMLGFVLNTHQQWLCRELSQRGYTVIRQVAVPDTGPAIQTAVREALTRVDLVITTGGLGPTSDDLTRECIAQLFGRTLCEDSETLSRIERFFRERNRPMPQRTRLQALVPSGARILPNWNGTAPGLVLEVEATPFGRPNARALLIMLPGPPRELEPMFLKEAMPLLLERFPPAEHFACRVLRSTGIGESIVEERIAPALQPLTAQGLEIGSCARFGEVDVRLVARGPHAQAVVGQAEETVRGLIGKHIFGSEADELPAV